MAIAGDPGSDPDRELSLDEIRALTDTVSIHALLKQLNQHEQRVDHELDELLDNRERLQTTMSSLVRLKYGSWHRDP
jgi:DNA-binding transcriptional MerR regulator